MQIENFRIWHWMIIGVIAGVLFSVVQAVQGPWFDNAQLETLDPAQFDWLAMYDLRPPANGWQGSTDTLRKEKPLVTAYHGGQPMLKDVVVHPAPPTDLSGQWWVTGKYFIAAPGAKDPKHPDEDAASGTWMPFKSPASAPYYPMYHSSHLVKVQSELDGLLKEQADAKASGKQLGDDKVRGIRDRRNELANDAVIQKAVGGGSPAPDSFANVGEFLKYAQSREPQRNMKYQVAFWEKKPMLWTLPALAGIILIGCGGPLMIQALQAMGLATIPDREREPAPKPKPVAALKKPVPVMAMNPGVKVIAPTEPKPMTEAEKKEYAGQYYPVVKSTHKETH